MEIVYTGEEAPITFNKSIFLAGPSPRPDQDIESWRKDVIQILEDIGFNGVVFYPENRRPNSDFNYDDQVEWERKYINMADCILFWVPRDLSLDKNGVPKLPAFTTNVEFGAWCNSGKVAFGCPKDSDKNQYLEHYCDLYNVPTVNSLTGTIFTASKMLGNGVFRTEGERFVPLFIWNTESFQSWYLSQKEAGNRLNHAEVLWSFRPGNKNFVFSWILKVNIFVEAEKRNKSNEFVFSRTDISSVLLWKKNDPIEESEVVLIKEFRSSSNTKDGFIRELPSGSSSSKENKKETAIHEVNEETGFEIELNRPEQHESRQLAGTLSAHKSNLYSVSLDEKEIEWFKNQKDPQGNVEDTEITYIEVYSVKDLYQIDIDWTTVGQILSVVYR